MSSPSKASPTPQLTYPTTVSRLALGRLEAPLVGWLVTIAITVLAFILRLYKVDEPNHIVFDETYYAKDAYALLHGGYERSWDKDVGSYMTSQDLAMMSDQASFIVHPPLGKQLISVGEQIFGMNALGWRFAAVVFGSGVVFLTIRLTRRLSRSNLIGAIAGILLCFDGLSFVMSRIALLDIFQAFFLVAAISAVACDRDYFKEKLASYLIRNDLPDLAGKFGPWIPWRPWRACAGIMFGASIAVKWNSLYVLAVVGLWCVASDWGIRRLAGASRASFWSSIKDGIPAFCYLVVSAIPVYLATWIPWLSSYYAQQRTWKIVPNETLTRMFGEPFAALVDYHRQMYQFHTGDFMMNEATHTYDAHPIGWLVIGRTIGINAVNDIKPGEQGCNVPEGETCLRVISGMGTPVLWWCAFLALLAGLVFWLVGRDSRFSLPILAMSGIWLPWFAYADRPVFYFYAVCIIPFTTVCLSLVLGKILGPANSSRRRHLGAHIVGGIVCAVIANFWFIYPILTNQLLPRSHWLWRMWFPSWI